MVSCLDEKRSPSSQAFGCSGPSDCTIWEGFSGIILLEEVCHWNQDLGVLRLTELPVPTVCFVLAMKDVRSQRHAPVAGGHASLP